MRLFVAVELPPAAQEELHAVQQRLDAHLRAAALHTTLRWIPPGNIHLTLRFLGETSTAQRKAIEQGLAAAALAHPPCTLEMIGLGAFPSFRRPDVIWAGLRGGAAAMSTLVALQAACEQVARLAAFPAETRPFSPHLTLARFRREAPAAAVAQAGALLRPLASGLSADPALVNFCYPLPVQQIALIHSDLRPDGAIYTPLARYALGAAPHTSP